MEFKDLNLHPDLQRGIAEAEYMTCMPVQEQVLTHAFGGQDLYVQSQTGTGKTAAFLIVIFQRLLSEDLLAGKKALIMVPTRELAVQVEEEAKLLGKYLPFKIGSFYGGVGYTQQQQLLKDNVQVLVGTPGRVLDLNKSGRMNLMDIAFLVLDEADRMFDMGFYPDLRKLIRVVPPADRRQTMLFSATLNAWVKNLAWEYTKSPFEIEIEPETVTVEEVEQVLYHVPSNEKMRLLLGILQREQPESAIIFCNTKRYTEIVAKRLRVNGYDCEFIIGDLPQVKRLKVIDDVKAGKTRFLVATDVAARGLDIEGLALVVNYDLPTEAENYVHRIGRTARAGKTGKAITLASEQDVYELPAIERYIGKKIPTEFAGEDRQGEDKSAGMRIHTDFYEDRREGRSPGGSRGGRRSPGDRASGERAGRGAQGDRPRGDRASAGRRPGDRPRSGEGRGDENRRQGGGRFREEPPPRRNSGGKTPRTEAKQDLSRLPFEERMAYYKQKYEAGPAEGAPSVEGAPSAGGGRKPRETEAPGRRQDRKQPSRGAPNKRQSPAGPAGGQSSPGGKRPEGRKPEPADGQAGQGRKSRSRGGQSPAGQRGQSFRGQGKGQGGQGQGSSNRPARPPEQEPKKGFFSRIFGIFKKKD
ncbi:MAG: DEAD/DEAH box helicase [Treponema sp.]|jgi:ATP-dependent RNA helicase RhlB|nr:DEAD/DEAH box helicase [Treponema sp.]